MPETTLKPRADAYGFGGPLLGIDGLIRRDTTVFVVENALAQISAVKVTPDGSSGSVIATHAVSGAETTTTAGLFGEALHAVDARFGTGTAPTTCSGSN